MVLIGTYKAIPIISSEFRLARRGSGQGDLVWDRMSYADLPTKKKKKKETDEDEDWPTFMEQLWDLQYVTARCPLTNELSEALYEVSYGITDLAIRIYMAAQIRAIETGLELITADLIRSAYRDDFRLVNRILEALKSGDISPFHKLEDVLPPAVMPIHQIAAGDIEDGQDGAFANPPPPSQALASTDDRSNAHDRSKARSPRVKAISGRDNIGSPAVKPTKSAKSYEQEDLRGIVFRGKGSSPSISGYQSLKEAGYIQAAAEFL